MAKKKKVTSQGSKFLVCIDDKEHTRVALRFACRKAQKTNSKIELLYVLDPVDFSTFSLVADTIKSEQRDHAEKLMQELLEECYEFDKMVVSVHIRQGMISEEIIQATEEDNDINMLILGAAPDGSSTRSNIFQAITSHIGDRLHIPVLIVPGNLTEQQIEELT